MDDAETAESETVTAPVSDGAQVAANGKAPTAPKGRKKADYCFCGDKRLSEKIKFCSKHYNPVRCLRRMISEEYAGASLPEDFEKTVAEEFEGKTVHNAARRNCIEKNMLPSTKRKPEEKTSEATVQASPEAGPSAEAVRAEEAAPRKRQRRASPSSTEAEEYPPKTARAKVCEILVSAPGSGPAPDMKLKPDMKDEAEAELRPYQDQIDYELEKVDAYLRIKQVVLQTLIKRRAAVLERYREVPHAN